MITSAERRESPSLNLTTTLFFTITPILALGGICLYARVYGVRAGDLITFSIMLALSGMSVTAGYHRYYAHRTYRCGRFLQVLYLLIGASSFEQSVLVWASDHRNHHRFTDEVDDPYNIRKGFWWAHIGWIFFNPPRPRDFSNAPDLTSDRLVMLQHRFYVPIAVAVTLGLPSLIGLAFGRHMGGLLWGGLLRMVVFHHCTFLINSAAHTVGNQPYSAKHSGRDSWWLAFFIFGEGYHNYHHSFPGDYRLGHRWWHFDPGKWFIRCAELLGLASQLHRTGLLHVESARTKMRSPAPNPGVEGIAAGPI